MVSMPPLGMPGEIVWVSIRSSKRHPDDLDDTGKLRPAMLVGELSDGRWVVVGLTTLDRYADGKPRRRVPHALWRPMLEQSPHLSRSKGAYLWGGKSVTVEKSKFGDRIGFAGPELRAFIMSSVDDVPRPMRSAVLRLTDEERAEARHTVPAVAPGSEWPLRPAVPPGQIHRPGPADARDSDVAQTEPPAPEPTRSLGPTDEPPMDTPDDTRTDDTDTDDTGAPTRLSDEVVAALAALARVTGSDDPVFRSTFSVETVQALIAEVQEGRVRHAEDREALASARTALVAARSEIQRLAKGETNWGGPETAAIAAIDESLRAA